MRLLLLVSVCYFYSLTASADWKLVCPGDVTVSCTINYSDLDQFGKAYIDHNGAIIWVKDCKVTYNINDCGYGTITRVWGAEDPDWKWVTCTQVITLSNADAFGEKDITWPSDVTLESCDPEARLKVLGKPYDRPYWKTNKCSKPMLNFSDMRFRVSDGCVKVVRTWKILDWCVYDPYKNPNAGIFSHTQVIKLITVDSAAKILCPRDTVVLAVTDCKGARIRLDSARVVSPCGMPYVIRNSSSYADTNTADASGFYPVGSHTFHYVAEYGCGKELLCEQHIEVRRAIPPVPFCKDGVIIGLMPADTDGDGKIDNGMVEVWASDLDQKSYHPCTKEKLRFSFSSDVRDTRRVFTCKEIGENLVEIWVTDSLGNHDLCKTKIIIQNNIGIPDCKKPDSLTRNTFDLAVRLADWYSGRDYNNVQLMIAPDAGGPMSQSQGAGPGRYFFRDLSKNAGYRLEAGPYVWPSPGARDLRWLDKFLKGGISKPSPYQIIAADLNADGRIDQRDLELLRRLAYGKMRPSLSRIAMVPDGQTFSAGLQALEEFRQMDRSVRSVREDFMEKNYKVLPLGVFYDYSESGLDGDDPTLLKSDSDRLLNCHVSGRSLVIGRETSNSNLAEPAEVRIYDMLGKLVFSVRSSGAPVEYIDLDHASMTSGIYLVVCDEARRLVRMD